MSGPGDRLGIEFITVLGLPPVEFVHLAADLGVSRIGLAPAPFTANPHRYPGWSLRDDAALRRELAKALDERGVEISLGEGFLIREGGAIGDAVGDMDLMADLGAERVNVVAIEPDRARSVDQLGRFAEMAGARGMQATLEFMPGTVFGDFAAAVAGVREVGRGNFKLLVDCMHFARSGSDPAELAAADPAAIGYLQLCDAPAKGGAPSYGEEAKHHRLRPAEGELPLAAILSAAPPDVPVGLEIPQVSPAEQGLSPRERLEPAIATARRMLADLPQSVEPS